MDPSGPAQPPKDTAYKTEGNPATSNPAEQHDASQHHDTHGQHRGVDERIPQSQSSGIQDALQSSLGYGVQGAPPGEEKPGHSEEDVGRHRELEGEQMRAPGEGDVADVVERKPGATGTQPDLASDIDRKKAEQASAREAVKDQRKHGKISDGADTRAGVDT